MLRETVKDDYSYLQGIVYDNIYKNVYLYIDVISYGFEDVNIHSYVLIDSFDTIYAIVYDYYNSLQLLEIKQLDDCQVEELASFIAKNKYLRISGNAELVGRLYSFLKDIYDITNGFLMEFINKPCESERVFSPFFAGVDDFLEIARLICSDPHLGKSYVEENLYNQLIKRYTEDGCESLCIKYDGKIVSHFATYAVTKDFAVMSGMVTDPRYRGKGMGSILVKDLSMHIIQQGKKPVLYCYEREYLTWYEKLGYSIIGTNSKLELK